MRARVMILALLTLAGTGLLGASPSQAATTLTGPDVAVYQHPNEAPIDWNAVRRDGRSFAFVKATQRTSYTNPWFARDWRDSAAAGLFRGAYHFADTTSADGTPQAQAAYFASTIGPQTGPGTLPPVLDLERDLGKLSVSGLQAWVQAFLDELERRTGRVPMIYTNPNFWRTEMGGSLAFTRYPLWIANYTTEAQPQDIGWRYSFWQYTSTGKVAGVPSTNTDINRFNGTSLDLAALARTGTWTAPTSTVSEEAPPGGPTTCGGFSAATPQRVVETRTDGTGPVASSRTFTLPDSVPADATSVQLDVTAVEATGAGYLRVGPRGTAPETTALTYGAGRSTTGLVTTAADGSRQVTVTVYGTPVHLAVDVLGWFSPTSTAQWFAAQPTRVGDTRTGLRLPLGPLSGNADLDLSSQVPSTATGVYLDVTATAHEGNGFVRLAAAGAAPTTTALNYDRAGATTGLAVTTLSNGHLTVQVNGARTDVVVDLLGWFDTSIMAGGQYCALQPQRFLDTRTGLGAGGPGTGPLALSVPPSVPDSAAAVVLDVSAVGPDSAGFVRLAAPGQEATTTALNTIRGRSVTGLVVVPVTDGQITMAAYTATTHMVIDVVGYLGSAAVSPDPSPSPSPSPT